jgi:hypothetical protein
MSETGMRRDRRVTSRFDEKAWITGDRLTHSADPYIIAYIQIGYRGGPLHGYKEDAALYERE